MTSLDKVKPLIRKVAKLMKEGHAGEKIAASQALERIIHNHGLDPTILRDLLAERQYRKITIPQGDILVESIIRFVFKRYFPEVWLIKTSENFTDLKKGTWEVYDVEMSETEYSLARELIQDYATAWKSHLKETFVAWLHVQELVPRGEVAQTVDSQIDEAKAEWSRKVREKMRTVEKISAGKKKLTERK
jgi:hypothetical protein